MLREGERGLAVKSMTRLNSSEWSTALPKIQEKYDSVYEAPV